MIFLLRRLGGQMVQVTLVTGHLVLPSYSCRFRFKGALQVGWSRAREGMLHLNSSWEKLIFYAPWINKGLCTSYSSSPATNRLSLWRSYWFDVHIKCFPRAFVWNICHRAIVLTPVQQWFTNTGDRWNFIKHLVYSWNWSTKKNNPDYYLSSRQFVQSWPWHFVSHHYVACSSFSRCILHPVVPIQWDSWSCCRSQLSFCILQYMHNSCYSNSGDQIIDNICHM